MSSNVLAVSEASEARSSRDWIEAFVAAAAQARGGDSLFLPGWREADWSKLLARTTPRATAPSEVVIQRGALDRALWFVATGWLEVGITHVDGVSIAPLARIGAGSVVGEQSFFDAQPRSANVWAVSEARLLRLDFADYERFAQEEPALAREFLFALARVLSIRLRHTSVRVRR